MISGFSGAGKGTLVKKLLSEYDNYALSISMTTRGPREGEQDGREYFFRTREQFEENIAKNGFIEYAQYCGNYYGTPKAYVEEQMQAGKDVILEIEIQGAMKIKEQFPERPRRISRSCIVLSTRWNSTVWVYSRILRRKILPLPPWKTRCRRKLRNSAGMS